MQDHFRKPLGPGVGMSNQYAGGASTIVHRSHFNGRATEQRPCVSCFTQERMLAEED